MIETKFRVEGNDLLEMRSADVEPMLKNPQVEEWPDFVQPMAGDPGYMTGAKVTSTVTGKRYVANRDSIMHSPEAWPAAWDEQP